MGEQADTERDRTLGAVIRRHRTARQWSQKTFAGLLGVSQAAVNDWEHDATQPRAERLARIEVLLGTSPGALGAMLYGPTRLPAQEPGDAEELLTAVADLEHAVKRIRHCVERLRGMP